MASFRSPVFCRTIREQTKVPCRRASQVRSRSTGWRLPCRSLLNYAPGAIARRSNRDFSPCAFAWRSTLALDAVNETLRPHRAFGALAMSVSMWLKSAFFPRPDCAWPDSKYRMRVWRGNGPQFSIEMRSAGTKFRLQVFPLVEQLSVGLGDAAAGSGKLDFGGIEAVAAAVRLLCDATEESTNRVSGSTVCTKARELWMMPVAASRTGEDFLREQGFAPCRDQSLDIQIAGVQSPKSHGGTVIPNQ